LRIFVRVDFLVINLDNVQVGELTRAIFIPRPLIIKLILLTNSDLAPIVLKVRISISTAPKPLHLIQLLQQHQCLPAFDLAEVL